MKHITLIPDCPVCGKELVPCWRGLNPTREKPWGTGIDGWWRCEACKYESEHMDHTPSVKTYAVPIDV